MSVVTVSLPPPTGLDTLILDAVAEHADVTIAAHTIVAAPPQTVFGVAKSLDLLRVRTPLLTASFWVRGLPARLAGRDVTPPGPLTLDGPTGLPGWMVLGEHPGHEIVFGAVGDFWHPIIRWNLEVTPDRFAQFAEPGWGKIACNYSTIGYGRHHTLLSYECRTTITDDGSRATFARYWWLVRPFVQHVMNATARTIAADAEARHGGRIRS